MLKKLGFLCSPHHFVVKDSGLHPDTHKPYYRIYTNNSSIMYFVLMLPGIGNLMSFIFWISSLTDNKYIEVDNKNYGKIVCSSEKK